MARKLAAIHCIDYGKTLRILGKAKDDNIKLAFYDIVEMIRVLVNGTRNSYDDRWREEM